MRLKKYSNIGAKKNNYWQIKIIFCNEEKYYCTLIQYHEDKKKFSASKFKYYLYHIKKYSDEVNIGKIISNIIATKLKICEFKL